MTWNHACGGVQRQKDGILYSERMPGNAFRAAGEAGLRRGPGLRTGMGRKEKHAAWFCRGSRA